MSQPPAYTRQYDFSDYQATNPSDPLPSTQVDAEYDAVKATLDAVLTNLALIQRDDGNLANSSVGPDQLSAAARSLLAGTITIQGAWETATAYVLLDVVTDSNTAYLCTEDHTSGTLATDINAGKWIVFGFEGAGAAISALSALTPAADKLPYFTGSAAASLATFTAAARTLMDDASVSDMRTTLGLGALAVLASINDDNWSGADLAVANGGTGASTAAAARTNLGAAGTSAANTFTKTQTWAKGADVASAGELTLGDGNYFDVTGTTAITSIATKGEGTVVKLHFDDALTLTHHATDLILPSGANITTAAGDEAEFVEYAAGDWRCTNYSKASGSALVGVTNVQSFTSSGTWNKPTSGTYALVECWGGGGSGGKNTDASEAGGGGGGGAYTYGRFLLSALGSSETVTIGAGGAARSTRSAGAAGGNTTFGSHLTAYGGGAGGLNSGGGGASPLAAGSVGNDGLTVAGGAAGSLGGAGGSSNSAGEDNWAGGGGGGSDTNGTGGFGGIGGAGGGGGGVNGDGAAGGNSYYGGGGGGGGWGGSGGGSTGGAGGTSQVGGNGGAGNTTGTDGTQPGGGGGGSNSGNSGAGGDGLVRVTVF